MQVQEVAEVLGPFITAALSAKGYDTLTPVQAAVLEPSLSQRDLRITSQTGSGKTLAIGFSLREHLQDLPAEHKPRAIVIAPTRELAHQSQAELTWLFAGMKIKVVSTTGGAGYRDELRALHRSPTVIVATPGRLLDHLNRGAIDASEVQVVVLDEADRMLDLGFREDLEAIFKFAPKTRRTHLVTATLPKQVRALADKVQSNPAHVQGTQLGAANADIDHVVHLIEPRSGTDAIINLLLAEPDAQTLIFAKMRVSVANIAKSLSDAGFAVATLSGELDQGARNRALTAFKAQRLRVLVATDVAARGIDVQGITQVIHADPPTDPDSYTHRSGRTGRAGRKGRSLLIVSPGEVVQLTRLLRQANVPHRFAPIPTAEMIRSSVDARVFEDLTREPNEEQPEPADGDARVQALAEKLAAAENPARAIARLLARANALGSTEPRDIKSPEAPQQRKEAKGRERHERGDRNERGPRNAERPQFAREAPAPRERSTRGAPSAEGGYTRFHVSWGARNGAEPHRLLAMVCRRGGIRGKDIGAIRVEAGFSLVDIASHVAEGFAEAAARPDPRDPHVRIRRDREGGAPAAAAPAAAAPGKRARPPREPAQASAEERGPQTSGMALLRRVTTHRGRR